MINRKQLYGNPTRPRWNKLKKVRHLTGIADLNVVQKDI